MPGANESLTTATDLTPERERWAEAAMVLGHHGDHPPVIVAERIGALARAGDLTCVARWRRIAALDRLMFGTIH